MRGKGEHYGKHHAAGGITPAYAGKRDVGYIIFVSFTDHPRLCGEKYTSRKATAERNGSPPPMRGKGSIIHRDAGAGRITPAYAGKSFKAGDRVKIIEDHPRLCGEKAF